METKTQPDQVTVALETLGCKLNQAETELLTRQLVEAGCRIVSSGDKADIYILNTCTVTHVADRKSRHLLRLEHRLNPRARIIALGCYADRPTSELSVIDGVEFILGNEDKLNLINLLQERGYLKPTDEILTSDQRNRTRSFIKAQDGCDKFCTYCIVPLVRGREKSLPADQVIREIRKRAEEGYQEVVLTGTEIGRYSDGRTNLSGLLRSILEETTIPRLRLSSVQPQEVDHEFIRLWENPRLCPHFHLSLQSGSDTVLERMNRLYSTQIYSGAVGLIRSEIPEVAVTTDIIVGFPGETDKEFLESYEFCRHIGFSRTHVFPYSPREGTRAAEMTGQIESAIKKQRSEKMLALARTSLENFNQRSIGKTREVLFEQTTNGLWSGLTDNYIKVFVKSSSNLAKRILPVNLVDRNRDGLWGVLIN